MRGFLAQAVCSHVVSQAQERRSEAAEGIGSLESPRGRVEFLQFARWTSQRSLSLEASRQLLSLDAIRQRREVVSALVLAPEIIQDLYSTTRFVES